jgi:hypothetical protein
MQAICVENTDFDLPARICYDPPLRWMLNRKEVAMKRLGIVIFSLLGVFQVGCQESRPVQPVNYPIYCQPCPQVCVPDYSQSCNNPCSPAQGRPAVQQLSPQPATPKPTLP